MKAFPQCVAARRERWQCRGSGVECPALAGHGICNGSSNTGLSYFAETGSFAGVAAAF